MLDAQTSPMIDAFACETADTSLTPIIQSNTSSLLVRPVEYFWGYTKKFGEADVSSFHSILKSDHKRDPKCKKSPRVSARALLFLKLAPDKPGNLTVNQ